MTSIKGDIRKVEEIRSALVGVTSVIHCAGVVDVRLFPNIQLMQDINVTGRSELLC